MNRTAQTVAYGTFPVEKAGVVKKVKCEVMKIGDRLRIIECSNNRSIDRVGYTDLAAIRKRYPGAV